MTDPGGRPANPPGAPAWPGPWPRLVRLIEQLAANAWPAGRTQLVEGWVFRSTPGVERRRSNSALPLLVDPAGRAEHAWGLDQAEDFYRRQEQACLVQVSPAELHPGLDAELARRGYERAAPTDVLVAPTGQVLARTAAVPGLTVLADDTVTSGWLEARIVLDARPPAAHEAEARWVLERICPAARFLTALQDGEPVGACLAVAERGWVGVFSMAILATARRRGVGSALLRSAAEWATEAGAHGLYLQVEPDNRPARGLYARAGFERAYGYHYRAAPAAGGRTPLRGLRRRPAETALRADRIGRSDPSRSAAPSHTSGKVASRVA